MKFATPRWWYARGRRAPSITRILLTPAAWIWSAVTARRIATTTPTDPGGPVICIGNITMGGAGKTPVARELLRLLSSKGIRAHGLSLGYGGRLKGPVRVDRSRHTAADVGDEPLMLARNAPMWISRDRLAGARAALAVGAKVVVMDDGFQNPSVKKALSLIVIDGETRDGEWPFGDGGVFPTGPMREPLAVGLARADAVVVLLPVHMDAPDPDLLSLFGDTPVLIARLEPVRPPPSGPHLGFAGVGKPWKVERALVAAGCDLVDFAPLPDHAVYSERTIEAIAARAASLGAGLVTTEKDWVRLPPVWRESVTAWPVRAKFQDEAALWKVLAGVI